MKPFEAVGRRARYYQRIAASYAGRRPSQLTFWWERPRAHPGDIASDKLGPYYMTFEDKARYPGPFDERGVPVLDYHGAIGRQHNPIAIAQYGLANFNAYLDSASQTHYDALARQAEWLRDELTENKQGVPVWMHRFDWEYSERLKDPWYSGLAQGQGISCLHRAALVTDDASFTKAAERAFVSLTRTTDAGGVLAYEGDDVWIEEYITTPASHILNGSIWALWGVRDHAIATGDPRAGALYDQCVETLERVLDRFDLGWWSRYDLVPRRPSCIASPFYHSLHVVQLDVMARLTGRPAFAARRDRWQSYASSPMRRRRALAQKAAFKLLHY